MNGPGTGEDRSSTWPTVTDVGVTPGDELLSLPEAPEDDVTRPGEDVGDVEPLDEHATRPKASTESEIAWTVRRQRDDVDVL